MHLPSHVNSYFDIPVTAELPRIICQVAAPLLSAKGIEVLDVRHRPLMFEEGYAKKHIQMKEEIGSLELYGQFPVLEVKEENGTVTRFAQSANIAKYLARLGELLGDPSDPNVANEASFIDAMNEMQSRVGAIVETSAPEDFTEIWQNEGVLLSLHRMENFLKQRLAEDDLPLESVGTGDKWVFNGRLGVVELCCAALRRMANFTYNEDINGNCAMFDKEGLHFLQGVAAAAETHLARHEPVLSRVFIWHSDEAIENPAADAYREWRSKFFAA
ncbi:MAG: hypothetical protein MHM6MM_004932 [Cercozoa sp. M6MM]